MPDNRSVMIVGAGLAGCSIAAAFEAKGYQVSIVDQHDAQIDPQIDAKSPAWPQQQPAVAAHVHLAADDNLLARLTRAALALCGQHVGELRRPGRLALDGPDPAQQEHSNRMLRNLPAQFARYVVPDEAADIAGTRVSSGGIWLPDMPLRVSADQPRIRPASSQHVLACVQRIEHHNGQWLAFDPNDNQIAGAPRVILATGSLPTLATLSGCLPGADASGLVVAGQSSRLSAPVDSLRTVVSGKRYVVPLPDGDWLIGASYRTGKTGIHPSRFTPGSAPILNDDNAGNLAVLPTLFDGANGFNIRDVTGYAGYRVMLPDRLPMIGPAPDVAAIRMQYSALTKNDRLALPVLPGVYLATGFGARGLLWSALAAEVMLDLFERRVPVLETDLMAAISPDRFLRRSLRRLQQV
jgi:tRNA 5-methylaminomethyl-2-thiouridine biosynthesis bifunctional protein